MTDDNQIWVVDDDNSIRWVIEKALSGDNIACKTFETADELLGALEHDSPKAIISDIRMPGMDGLTLLRELKAIAPDTPVIITTAHSDLDSAVTSYESGAFEYLPKPFDIDEMLEVASRALAYTQKETIDQAGDPNSGKEIIGNAPAMQEVFRAIGRLSQSAITVLISGQSGSGKELVARALHQHSPRAKAPFVALNMAAIPKDLMESELFGHEKGSFTGAAGRREGRFEQANGGTLFLDEIGDMPHETQTRLLRVLAEGEFFRVGGATAIKTDVRVIAATHQDLRRTRRRGLIPRGPVSPAQRYRHKCAKTRRAPRRHPTIAQSLSNESGLRTRCAHEGALTSGQRLPHCAGVARKRSPARKYLSLAHSNGRRKYNFDERSAT